MARGDRVCVIDGTKYRYCPDCNHGNPNETWRYLYCSENCRNIYKTVEKWCGKKITSDEAKEALDGYVLPSSDKLQKSIKKNIDQIMASATVEHKVLDNKDDNITEKPKKTTMRRRKIVNDD